MILWLAATVAVICAAMLIALSIAEPRDPDRAWWCQ